ncbi:hypothetical protein [Tellurirhabdus rosea]|uniref:hypothetical protein n=1 Tax=Tellurirhabdus rosea TaxID=2674997 RepID=UPI00225482EE|nr:hypothetical protein [Tellurirhabdus rosea]
MKSFSLSLLLFSLSLWCSAQVRISNVRVQASGETSLEILYDAAGLVAADSVWFEVKSRTGRSLQPGRAFITGDVGLDVADGPNRRILWNVLANGYELDEEIRVTVLVNLVRRTREEPGEKVAATPPPAEPTAPASPRLRRPGGPGYALLSAIAPGIGNIFVQNPKPRVGLRPLVTVATYGLVAYGLIQRRQSRDEYALYNEQKNAAAAESFYTRANSAHQRYYVATRLAAAVWATDVIATALQGIRNQRAQRNREVRLRPGVQAGQWTAVVQLTF